MANPTQPRKKCMEIMDQNIANAVHKTRDVHTIENQPRPLAPPGGSFL